MEAQRRHPDVRMAAIADDFYAAGDPTDRHPPTEDGGEAPLFAAVETKRLLCKANCNTDSNISKLACFSPEGDLTGVPRHIPGSPNQLRALTASLRPGEAA